MGNDEPEGDMPVLLQTLLSRNPKIFRDKSMSTKYKVWGGKEEMLSHAVDVALKLSVWHAFSVAVLWVSGIAN